MIKKCLNCETEYELTKYWKRYCSVKCKNSFHARVRKEGAARALEKAKEVENEDPDDKPTRVRTASRRHLDGPEG